MSSETLIYIILSGIIALLLALFLYRTKEKRMTKNSMLFAFLRFLSVFLILLLLINPKFETLQFYDEKPNLIVAVDNSGSISYLNQSEAVQNLVDSIKTHEALNNKFAINYFAFGSELEATDSLTFDDQNTNIDRVFNEISQIYPNENAPIVLLTDGNQTYGNDYSFSANDLKQPVFPVILGDTITYTDLKLQQLNVNKYAFLKNRFPVEAIVTYNGNTPVNSRFVITSGASTIYSQEVVLNKTTNSKVLSFSLPTNRVGVQTYQAQILPISNEKNIVNNAKNFAVEVIDQKTNVALISDFLHPDLGALKKSIESNEQRSVTIMKPNEYESQYNDFQLVIIYQPNNNFKSVYERIKTLNSNTFTLLGTQTDYNFLNAQTDSYKHDITNQTEEYQAILNPNFSAFIVDDLDFESFPPLRSAFGNMTFSIPEEVLLKKSLRQIDTKMPLLVTLEANNRREALLLGENLWKWRAQSFLNSGTFDEFDNFIGKLVQYLATSKRKDRLSIDYETFYQGQTNVIVKAQFFNKNYEFDNKESLQIILKHKETQDTNTYPFILKGNNYQVDLSHLDPGSYDFTVKATNETISRSGTFQILEYNIEQQFLNANVTKLQQVATNSNGQSYFIANKDTLFNDLIQDDRFNTIQKSSKNIVPLIDWKYLLGLIVLCLALEWFLRKYNGLI